MLDAKEREINSPEYPGTSLAIPAGDSLVRLIMYITYPASTWLPAGLMNVWQGANSGENDWARLYKYTDVFTTT